MIKTIWSRGAVDHVPARYRLLIRFAYPVIYATNFLVYGVLGAVTGGSNVLQQTLPVPFANTLLGLIGVFAAVGLAGVVFGGGARTCRGQYVERVGAIGLIPTTTVYLVVLVVSLFGPAGDPNNRPPAATVYGFDPGLNTPLAALVGTVVMVVFAVLRAADLSVEIGKRGRTREGA